MIIKYKLLFLKEAAYFLLLKNYFLKRFNEFLIESTKSPEHMATLKEYEKLQLDYRDYRSIIAAFISAANFMESLRFEDAALFFCVACEYNERITGSLEFRMKGMDHEHLLANRRECLRHWSTSCIRKIMRRNIAPDLTSEEVVGLIENVINKFLPCFFRLANSTAEDKAMIDTIRQDWLAILDSNVPELPEIFHSLMTKLFEDQVSNHYHSLNVNKTNLSNRYRDTYRTLEKFK